MTWNEPFGRREGTKVKKRDTHHTEETERRTYRSFTSQVCGTQTWFQVRQDSSSLNLFMMCIMRSAFIVTAHLCRKRTTVRLPMIHSLSVGLLARGATVWVGAEGGKEILHSKSNLVTSNVKLGLQRGSEYATPQKCHCSLRILSSWRQLRNGRQRRNPLLSCLPNIRHKFPSKGGLSIHL